MLFSNLVPGNRTPLKIMSILTLLFVFGLAVPIYILARAKNYPFVILYLIFYVVVIGNML